MYKCKMDIALIDSSEIIYKGLASLLIDPEIQYTVYFLEGIEALENIRPAPDFRVVIINPTWIQNRLTEFVRIKRKYPRIKWIGLIYSYFDKDLLIKLDDTMELSDPVDCLLKKLKKYCTRITMPVNAQEHLSDRETDVLIHLVNGLSNKEIADRLNISIHTVISHRKNIIEKTGIKSLSGLTIYAISKKIISFDAE